MRRFAALLGLFALAAAPPGTPAARLEAIEAQYPPWQEGRNNGAPELGLVFTVPPADVMAEHRAAALRAERRPVSRAGAAVVAALWLLAAGLLAWRLWPGAAR